MPTHCCSCPPPQLSRSQGSGTRARSRGKETDGNAKPTTRTSSGERDARMGYGQLMRRHPRGQGLHLHEKPSAVRQGALRSAHAPPSALRPRSGCVRHPAVGHHGHAWQHGIHAGPGPREAGQLREAVRAQVSDGHGAREPPGMVQAPGAVRDGAVRGPSGTWHLQEGRLAPRAFLASPAVSQQRRRIACPPPTQCPPPRAARGQRRHRLTARRPPRLASRCRIPLSHHAVCLLLPWPRSASAAPRGIHSAARPGHPPPSCLHPQPAGLPVQSIAWFFPFASRRTRFVFSPAMCAARAPSPVPVPTFAQLCCWWGLRSPGTP